MEEEEVSVRNGGGNEFDSEEVATELVKCPNCGHNLVFSGNEQKLVCKYCGTKQDIQADKDVKGRPFSEAENVKGWDGTRLYTCNNCGAREVLKGNDVSIALKCPYCASTNVIKSDGIPGIKPDSLIPFAFDDDRAERYYTKWIKGKFFAPRALKENFAPDDINGVYCPSWIFDSLTHTDYAGRLGQTRTRTVGSGKNRHTETYIHWFRVRGQIEKIFNDIIIEASKRLKQKDLNQMKPFPKSGYTVYSDKFLEGFIAEHYDEKEDIYTSFKEAEVIMAAEIKRAIMARYRADHWGGDMKTDMKHLMRTFKYSLLPVYVCAFSWRQKVYNFFINGITGRVAGHAPVSKLKVFIAAAIGIAVAAGAFVLFKVLSKQ